MEQISVSKKHIYKQKCNAGDLVFFQKLNINHGQCLFKIKEWHIELYAMHIHVLKRFHCWWTQGLHLFRPKRNGQVISKMDFRSHKNRCSDHDSLLMDNDSLVTTLLLCFLKESCQHRIYFSFFNNLSLSCTTTVEDASLYPWHFNSTWSHGEWIEVETTLFTADGGRKMLSHFLIHAKH